MRLTSEEIKERLAEAERLRLFLDYDGTLSEFAPTPDHIDPDPALIALLTELARDPRIKMSVVSGRRLAHIQKLLPVPGALLAGTYGIEMQTPEGERIDRLDYDAIRPVLDALKPTWADLISEYEGFFLEDKGWALAIHGRRADEEEAVVDQVLETARRQAEEAATKGPFRVLGGYKFVEIGPRLAHKGKAIDYLLGRYPWPDALIMYIGDDDKDEEAFDVIKKHGGLAILVASEPREANADFRLESPAVVRRWLRALPERLGGEREAAGG